MELYPKKSPGHRGGATNDCECIITTQCLLPERLLLLRVLDWVGSI